MWLCVEKDKQELQGDKMSRAFQAKGKSMGREKSDEQWDVLSSRR